MMKHFIAATLAACVLAAPAHAAPKLGMQNPTPPAPEMNIGGDAPCLFAHGLVLDAIMGSEDYGIEFLPKYPGPNARGGPVVLNECADFPVIRGAAFGKNFLALNKNARDRNGRIPMLPLQMNMTIATTYLHMYVAGSPGGRVKLRAWRGGEPHETPAYVLANKLQKVSVTVPGGDVDRIELFEVPGTKVDWLVIDGIVRRTR